MNIELVVWRDAASDADGWTSADSVEDTDTLIRSVGFVVKDTERYLTLAMDLSDDGSSHTRGRIPKGMIVSRAVIQEGNS